jgi:Flp pilus assembly protein TadG
MVTRLAGTAMKRKSLFRDDDGSVVVEFGLIIPVFILLIWAVIAFGQGYQRMNILTGALRDGARYGSTLLDPCGVDAAAVQDRVAAYASAFGIPLAAGDVTVGSCGSGNVSVGVQDHALFTGIGFFGLDARLVTRSVTFRWERSP